MQNFLGGGVGETARIPVPVTGFENSYFPVIIMTTLFSNIPCSSYSIFTKCFIYFKFNSPQDNISRSEQISQGDSYTKCQNVILKIQSKLIYTNFSSGRHNSDDPDMCAKLCENTVKLYYVKFSHIKDRGV